jgi:lysophospholipase L1-like esterase
VDGVELDLRPMSQETETSSTAPAETAPARPRRSWQRKLKFSLFIWLVVAVVGEGGARVYEHRTYGTTERAGTTIYGQDEDGFTDLKPNTDVSGASMQIHVNALGFRGHEVAIPKPAGTTRIVCIGASTTFDTYAKSDDTAWPARLEQKLRVRYPQVEVVNAAVPGHTVDDYLRAKKWKRIEALAPDIVISYFATNEIANEARNRYEAKTLHCPNGDFDQPKEMDPDLGACPRCRAKLVLRDPTPPPLERAIKAITDWSLFLYKVKLGVDRWVSKPVERVGTHDLPESAALAFEKKLDELFRRAKAAGARPALGTFALKWRADQPPEKQRELATGSGCFSIYIGLSVDGINRALGSYNEAIRRVARSGGYTLIPVAEELSGDPALFGDFVHFSSEGSERMATVVAREVEASGALGPGPR